ncbi:MAG: DUF4149 domain-containing protein [Acidobacteriota bacterium]|nr:DUF4149 domain-containing protein [Acidobacteriota bacterium]
MADKIKSGLVAAWLGAALFFSAVVAPSAFMVLRQFNLANANEIAGTIVSRTLTVVNISGFVIGLVLLAAVFFKTTGPSLRELLALAVLTSSTAVGHWVVAARMLALRAAMTIPIDAVGAGDPRRQSFDTLHHYSVGLLSAAMIAAIVTIILFGTQARTTRPFRK